MKKLLLATVFGLVAFSAQAQEQKYPTARSYADITNPFYIPEKAFLADSNLSYSRVKLNHSINAPEQTRFGVLKDAHKYTASETLTYGITGTWAVYGTYAYDWTKKEGASSFRDWAWTVGTKVNTIDDAWRVQIGADLTRSTYTKWKGVINEDQKNTHLYLMAGTETGDKVFVYARADYQNIGYGDDLQYDVFSIDAAAHLTPAAETSADAGLRFSWDSMANVKSKDLTFFADGYMNLYRNIALGLKFDYVLASTNNIKMPFAPTNQGTYTLGVNLKYEF
ncbi:MAG: hypothetical protein J5716_08920 [Alphaproteobacteria bacterium]|nr:hypothetical protein [Alphaproteobacteria bacterium]